MPTPRTREEKPIPRRSFATVLPLNYSESRIEHSVIYCSNEWEDLVKLLSNPVEFFKTQKEGWSQKVGPDLEWKFKEPISAIIMPGKTRRRKGRTQPGFFQGLLDPSLETLPEGLTDVDPQPGKPFVTPSRIMRTAHKTGAFFAEFAMCTGVLIIRYWPPRVPNQARYKHDFTSATFGMIRAPEGKATGTLHFDLASTNEEPIKNSDHAELIVDWLETRIALIDNLNAKRDFERGVVYLYPKGTKIDVPAEPMKEFDLEDRFKKRLTAPDAEIDFPTIMIHDLRSDADSVLCCNVFVNEEAGGFEIGDMLLKGYIPCPPPGG